MTLEIDQERSDRILGKLKEKHPGKNAFDLDGRGLHFVCEVEPTTDHPEYDRAVEVIISSNPHKHFKMTQNYTILAGNLELHIDDEVIQLKPGDRYAIQPQKVHGLQVVMRLGWKYIPPPDGLKKTTFRYNLNNESKNIQAE